jgi:DNA-binding NarL/FixJ family response regulator
MSGEEVLRRIKCSAKMRAIPVIIFTSLTVPDEIRRIYALGASCVMGKPLSLDEFDANMRTFASFWGHVAVLPFCGQDV